MIKLGAPSDVCRVAKGRCSVGHHPANVVAVHVRQNHVGYGVGAVTGHFNRLRGCSTIQTGIEQDQLSTGIHQCRCEKELRFVGWDHRRVRCRIKRVRIDVHAENALWFFDCA